MIGALSPHAKRDAMRARLIMTESIHSIVVACAVDSAFTISVVTASLVSPTYTTNTCAMTC